MRAGITHVAGIAPPVGSRVSPYAHGCDKGSMHFPQGRLPSKLQFEAWTGDPTLKSDRARSHSATTREPPKILGYAFRRRGPSALWQAAEGLL